MKYNKSHFQLGVEQLEKHEFRLSDKNRRPYTTYIEKCVDLFYGYPAIKAELNSAVVKFCRKWNIGSIDSAENIYFCSLFYWGGQRIRHAITYKRYVGEKLINYTKYVELDIKAVIKDIKDIKHWCHAKVVDIARQHEIDFTSEVQIGK